MDNAPALLKADQKLIPIADLFKKSFASYKPKIWTMMALGLIECAAIVSVFILCGLIGITTFIFVKPALVLSLWTVLLFLVGMLLVIVISIWIQVALIYIAGSTGPNGKVGIKNALMAAKDKMVSYGWVVVLRGLVVLVGFILLVIPGIIFSVWFCLSHYVVIFENVKGFKALRRSRELVKGYCWPVFGRLLLLAMIAILVSSVSKLGFLLNFLFTMPFGMVYLYVMYDDLKNIKTPSI